VLVEKICAIEPTVLLTTLPMVAQQLEAEEHADREQVRALFLFQLQASLLLVLFVCG
jgi:hypothetical protein